MLTDYGERVHHKRMLSLLLVSPERGHTVGMNEWGTTKMLSGQGFLSLQLPGSPRASLHSMISQRPEWSVSKSSEAMRYGLVTLFS